MFISQRVMHHTSPDGNHREASPDTGIRVGRIVRLRQPARSGRGRGDHKHDGRTHLEERGAGFDEHTGVQPVAVVGHGGGRDAPMMLPKAYRTTTHHHCG